MDFLILVALAVLPPLAFLLYINHLDKLEPEPHGLILKALILGAGAVIPAAIAEALLLQLPVFAGGGFSGAAYKSFAVISPVEEAAKLAVVLLFIWNNPSFNEENDGIVYVGAASIGFSLLENVLYVTQNGPGTGIMRAVTAVPLHTFTGVIMGYFVGIARFAPAPAGRRRKIWIGFLAAYLIHGAYDTLVLSETAAALLVVPVVVALFVLGFIYLKKGAALSARRWGGTPGVEPGVIVADGAAPRGQGRGTYKIVISRAIFALCAVFWSLIIIGMIEATGVDAAGPHEIIGGGFILTVIPAAIGVLLEVSYNRQKKRAAAGS